MANLSSLKASGTHRAILFGGPKAGKTLLAGKLAEHFKLIWVDMENGHETLFQLPEAWQNNIELIALRDTRSYPIAIETVLKMVKGPVAICEAHGKVSCMICKKEAAPVVDVDLNSLRSDTIVVFDSLTQLTSSAIANMTKGKPDDYKLVTDDWGNLGKLLDIFLSHLQQANYNVVVISHETEIETEGKKKQLVPVGGTRNYSRNVAKFFDHVIYVERKNKKHMVSSSTTGSSTILTGSRSNIAMELEAEASLLQIFRPDLYVSTAVAKAPITSGAKANSILERLKAK